MPCKLCVNMVLLFVGLCSKTPIKLEITKAQMKRMTLSTDIGHTFSVAIATGGYEKETLHLLSINETLLPARHAILRADERTERLKSC